MTVRRVPRPQARDRVAPSAANNLLKTNVTAWYAEWKARKAAAVGAPAAARAAGSGRGLEPGK